VGSKHAETKPRRGERTAASSIPSRTPPCTALLPHSHDHAFLRHSFRRRLQTPHNHLREMVNWIIPSDDKPISMKVRPLIIDTRVSAWQRIFRNTPAVWADRSRHRQELEAWGHREAVAPAGNRAKECRVQWEYALDCRKIAKSLIESIKLNVETRRFRKCFRGKLLSLTVDERIRRQHTLTVCCTKAKKFTQRNKSVPQELSSPFLDYGHTPCRQRNAAIFLHCISG